MKFLLSLLAFASAKNLYEGYTFSQFVQEFEKTYESDEYKLREQIFADRLQMIQEHNQAGHSWTMGVNKFADMTDKEIAMYRGYNKQMARTMKTTEGVPATTVTDLPTSVDWRDKNVVSPVKDQGGCGSCWAFSATESVESAWAIKHGNLPILAPQELVDCVPNPDHCGGTGGCEGATMELAFKYVQANGFALESDYPYKGRDGSCKHLQSAANITDYTKNKENDLTALMTAVATVGPQSITVDASHWSFYSGGIFDGCKKNTDLDHGVQLVGYGTEGGKDYWLVRNSWGPSWGEEGYIRLERKAEGSWCGTDSTPADGTGCAGGPSKVETCGMCGILYDTCYPIV